MITIWGRETSSNVQTAMWAIGELGLEHERIDWGGAFGGNDEADYRAMNPNGLIPTLKDGDTVLWESATILRYLSARYGDEAFWPSDPAARAKLDMWAEWIKTAFAQAVMQVFWQQVRTPAAERSAATIAAGTARLAELAPILDARLGQGPWLAGADFGFADIMVGHLLYRYYTLDFERTATPNLDAYYARLQERDAYREHSMVSYESLRVD